MAYIAPNSTVILLKNIPLEPNFENTVWYNNETEQEQDFLQQRYSPRTFTAQSYVHKERGAIRIEAQMAQVYDCNYMMFKNTSFENKWFYAFITHVEYVSNEVCEVYFAIDPIQTWLKRFTVDPCFIAREHTYTDTPKDWAIPESIDPGQYYAYNQDRRFSTNDLRYYIAAPFTIEFDEDDGWQIWNYQGVKFVGGVPSGILYSAFTSVESLAEALWFLNGATTVHYMDSVGTIDTVNKGALIDAIVSIFIAPYQIFNDPNGEVYEENWETYIPKMQGDIPWWASSTPNSEQRVNYVIKNNKLCGYPYCYHIATDYNGNDTLYRPELFYSKPGEEYVKFKLIGDAAPNGGVIAVPFDYKGSNGYSDIGRFNRFEQTAMRGFPTITWSVDVWRGWLSSTGVETAVDKLKETLTTAWQESKVEQPQLYSIGDMLQPNVTIKDALVMMSENARRTQEYNKALNAQNPNSLSSIIAGKAHPFNAFVDYALKIGGAFNVLRGVIKNMSQYYQQSLKPNTVQGSQSGGARLALNEFNLTYTEYGVSIERAQVIDRFFTAYGYATNRFGKPHLFDDVSKSRPYINFVQTAGANIHGNIPKDSADAIADIFDAGVRFWTAQPSGGYPSPLANVNNYSELENLNSPPLG